MAYNGGSQANGPATRPRRLRVPTVDEAFPYSPFSSIVPFNPELVTPPMAHPSIANTAFEDSEDIKTARRELERLSAGARDAESASKRCQQTLSDVQRLLDPDTLPHYRFRTSKRTSKSAPRQQQPSSQKELSDFASLVYKQAKVEYSYATPEATPESDENIVVNHRWSNQPGQSIAVKKQRQSQQSPTQQPAKKPTIKPEPDQANIVRNRSGDQFTSRANSIQHPQPQNGYIQDATSTPSKHTPKAFVLPATLTPAQLAQYRAESGEQSQFMAPAQSTSMAYAVPAKLTPAERAEYEKVPAQRELTPSKNQSAYLTNGARAASIDQRNKSDRAVENMQSLLSAIFEAEDYMQPDTSGANSMQDNPYFMLADVDDGSVPLLKIDALLRVDAATTKVYANRCIDSIELERLARIQRLFEARVNAAESGLLHVGEDWEEQDVSGWLERIASAQNGLIAARTMMRIMAGGARYKELQSEDHLHLVLDTVRSAVEGCVIPIIEMRPTIGDKIRGEKSAPSNPAFQIASENRKTLQAFLQLSMKCLQVLGDLYFKTDIDETGISRLELLCKTLIFAENAGTDKDAALGTQVFEELRKVAMDVVARVFEKYTAQREFIVDDMLLSLDKLPATKQNARQYTLPDSKPIQLVSALLMRLVQTSATAQTRSKALHEHEDAQSQDEEDEDDESEDEGYSDSDGPLSKVKVTKRRDTASKKLPKGFAALYQPLQQSAQKLASYIAMMLLQRALGSSKSSEEPFRRLLDIFVDDFLSVLGSTDWPAAELLLRALVSKLVALAEDPKKPAPARNLALEVLGNVGSSILDLRTIAINSGNAIDTEDRLSARLAKVARSMESGDVTNADLTAINGPYRVVLEYLHARDIQKWPNLQSACGLHLIQWADMIRVDPETSEDRQHNNTTSNKTDQVKLRGMIEDVTWLPDDDSFPLPSTDQGKFAGRLVAANSKLCKAFVRIFTVILKSMTSEQPTVRSRAVKSVNALVEKDPSVLDRDTRVLSQVLRSLSDASSLVRESALGMLQKCTSSRPGLELRVYKQIVPRTKDTSVSVRKRAMAFLKDAYLRHDDNAVRATISTALISRITDTEESVAEVARATIEEVWFSKFSKTRSNEQSVDDKLRLSLHAALVIQTIELGENVAAVLESMVKKLLTGSKQASENERISKMFVAVMSEFMIQDETPGHPSRAATLHALEVFAKAWPKLFTPDQLSHLEPYTKNVQNTDDLEVYRHVVTILRHTLPVVTGIQEVKLHNLLNALMTSVSKMSKSELAVIAPCIATIDAQLGDTGRPCKLVHSVLLQLYDMRQAQRIPDERKAVRLLTIIGQLGKSCDLESQLQSFKTNSRYTWYKGNSVAGLLVEIICYFSSPKQSIPIREAAMEAVCEICQTHPEHFERADVVNAIEAVFQAHTKSLEAAMLTSLEVFFAAGVAGADEQPTIAAGIEGGAQRLGGTYKATGHDKASAALSQRFLKQFLRIALSSVDDVALTAAHIVVHINTSGLSYPQDSAAGLVALETCPNSAIAALAFQAHKEQYGKYESIFEKQLIKSVSRAFEYQVGVLQSASGCEGSPPVAKLHFCWDVMKNGKSPGRRKFFMNLCSEMDFDPAKLKLNDSGSRHLMYVRFCVENLAFFEYHLVPELLHLVTALEKTVAGTGTEIAQAIESEVQNIQVPSSSSSAMEMVPGAALGAPFEGAFMAPNPHIDRTRLAQLASSAQILSLIWETRTYLRKANTLAKYDGKPKLVTRDDKKMPSRATNVSALTDAYQATIKRLMQPILTDEARREMCMSFVQLYSVDSDVKVGSGDEENMDVDDEDDARSESSSTKSTSVGATPRGKKRKSIDGGMNGASKKRRGGNSSVSKMEDDDEGGWD